MAFWRPFYILLHLALVQKVIGQIVPLQNGCVCQKPQAPQNQLINLQLPNPNCNNCQNNLQLSQLQVPNGLQLNNALANKLVLANLPNVPIGQPATIINNLPLNNLPLNNLQFNNLPVNNLPIFNSLPAVNNFPVLNNLPIANNLPYNLPVGNSLNRQQIVNNLPIFNNLPLVNNVPVRNNLPVQNNIITNLPLGNLPANCLNSNGVPINLLNGCIQLPNANLPILNNGQIVNNLPVNNVNRLPNVNVLPNNLLQQNNLQLANLPFISQKNLQSANQQFIQQNKVQVANAPFNQLNNVQFANVPFPNNGLQLNLPNSVPNQQLLPNLPANKDCGCTQSGLALLVENGLANSNSNVANNVPLVSLNGLQLGGLGGLGNLPLFNGLPVIGVTESVVNLNNPCN